MSDTDGSHIATIETGSTPACVIEVLTAMSKRGKLPGFEARSQTSAVADAHGTPFDSDLLIDAKADGEGAAVTLEVRLRRKMPLIFVGILILTVWPGLPLTDSFLLGFGWYERLMSGSLETWMWYLPLTIIPAPFAVRSSIRKSKLSGREHAIETSERIRAELGA